MEGAPRLNGVDRGDGFRQSGENHLLIFSPGDSTRGPGRAAPGHPESENEG